MLNRTRIVACTVPVVMTLACSGADGVRSRRASSSISPVVNCEAVDDSDLLVDQANALFDPQYVEPRPAPAPKMGERMGSGWLQDGGPLDAFPTLDAGANDPASVSVRHRAAILCACRARSHRSWARTDGKWSDALTVVGAVGTIGGGAVNSVAATGLEDDTRRALLTSGILTMAVGSAAFALNAALNESKRVEEHHSAAEDEEVAATILWNDHADATQWSNAWIHCAEAEGFASGARLTNPEQAVAQIMSDAGASTATHGAEAGADGAGH